MAILLGVTAVWPLRLALAQVVVGDVNGDGQVTADDLLDLVAEIFDGDGDNVADVGGGAFPGSAGADANQDGHITAADFVSIVVQQPGLTPVSPTVSPTPQLTTPISTPTPTPNPTPPTATVTSTPPECAPVVVTPKSWPFSFSGFLAPGDCTDHGSNGRFGDAYQVSATSGQAVKVTVVGTGFTPRIVLSDAGGYFGSYAGASPIEWLATTNRRYTFSVTSAPPGGTGGSYTVTISVRNCPPRQITLSAAGTRLNRTLLDTDCPDPAQPSSPAHRFTFYAQAGTTASVKMTTSPNNQDTPDPFLTIYGPPLTLDPFPAIELASDDNSGGGDNGTDALLSFYAVESGTYTLTATGGIGPYTIAFSIPSCKVTPTTVSNQVSTVVDVLTASSCPAPLPLPAAPKGDPNSAAAVRTISAAAGDVIAAKMSSDDFDAQLYLLGPDHSVLASDDDGSEDGGTDAQLAFTVPQAGAYTLIAASNDASVTQDGLTHPYSLTLQKCPASSLSFDTPTSQSLLDANCHGTNGVLMNSYSLESQTPGQFISATMIADPSSSIDAVLTLTDPTGRLVTNDNDPFSPDTTTDARVSQVLPQAGTYFLTATSTQDGGGTTGNYALLAQRCRTIPATAGTVQGDFRDDDCEVIAGLPDGSTGPVKLNVFAVATGANQSLSLVPPDGACVLAATPDWLQGPGPSCITDFLAMPLAGAGTTAVLVAAPTPDTRGSYSFALQTCLASNVISYGSSTGGYLTGSACRDASGEPSLFLLFRAPKSLVLFNSGATGRLVDSFGLGSVVVDATGVSDILTQIDESPEDLFPLDSDFGCAFLVRAKSSDAMGSFTLDIDPAQFHQ